MWSPRMASQPFPAAAVVFTCMSLAFSQIPNLQSHISDVLAEAPELAELTGTPSLTTSIDDAVFGFPPLDDYEPDQVRALAEVPLSTSGTFLLEPGFYEGDLHSYCLKPGTHGPGGGEGYLYGALRGPYAEIAETMLRESGHHPEVSRNQIQMLLWALISRTGIKGLSPDLQWAASRLLSWDQIYRLNGGALGLVPPSKLEGVLGGVPKTIIDSLKAEAAIRSMLVRGSVSYADLERVAILSGSPMPNLGGTQVPSFRWSVHPSGYLVRYHPKKVSQTRVQVWVPRHVSVKLDYLGRIASLHDNWGNLLSLTYASEDDDPRFPSDSALRHSTLDRIRWTRFEGSGRVTDTVNIGKRPQWTWYRPMGATFDSPTIDPVRSSMPSPNGTYREAVERDCGVRDFSTGLLAYGRQVPAFPTLISNLLHLRSSIRSSLNPDDHAVKACLALIGDGVAAELRRQISGTRVGGRERWTEFDPASDVAVPANTGRQRLGLSPRLH